MRRLSSPPPAAVGAFLSALDDEGREAFLSHAENTYSVYEIWLYAGVLGYEGTFVDLESWVQATYPKLNRQKILLGEIVKLEGDIAFLRQQVEMDLIKADVAGSRIAQLSKELRGHIAEIDKMSKALDRRGLILSGADHMIRALKAIFKGNNKVLEALDLACQSAWAELAEDS